MKKLRLREAPVLALGHTADEGLGLEHSDMSDPQDHICSSDNFISSQQKIFCLVFINLTLLSSAL